MTRILPVAASVLALMVVGCAEGGGEVGVGEMGPSGPSFQSAPTAASPGSFENATPVATDTVPGATQPELSAEDAPPAPATGPAAQSPTPSTTGSAYTGQWKDMGCRDNVGDGFMFFCEGSGACPADCEAQQLGGADYCFCDTPMLHPDAASRCEGVGMTVAEIDDAAENDAMAVFMSTIPDFAPNDNSSALWLNGTDAASEGKWLWGSTGTQFWDGDGSGSDMAGVFQAWMPMQPNGGTGENCAAILYSQNAAASAGGAAAPAPAACANGSFFLQGCCRYCADFCECM